MRSAETAAWVVLGWALWMRPPGAAAEQKLDVLQAELAQLRSGPESPKRWGEEARILYYLSQRGESGDKARHREEGKQLAEKALSQNPYEPAALLWWSAFRGAEVSPLNPFMAVKIARQVEDALQRLRTIAPDYDYAAADRVLGKLYRIAPAGLSIGDMARAGRHLLAAVQRYPDFPGNQLFYAEWLLEVGKCKPAAEVAQKVLQSSHIDEFPLDGDQWRAEAEELIRKSQDCE